jgi:hypothetical protein
MPRKNPHDREILYGMAKGPWADAWAREEEEGGRSFSGQNIYDICPEPPRAARSWARKVADKIVTANGGLALEALFLAAREAGFGKSREDFGFYLGCQACGMGIQWDDDLSSAGPKIEVPYDEFFI